MLEGGGTADADMTDSGLPSQRPQDGGQGPSPAPVIVLTRINFRKLSQAVARIFKILRSTCLTLWPGFSYKPGH